MSFPSSTLRLAIPLSLVALTVGFVLAQPAATSKKYALLVGVNHYDHGKLKELAFAEADVGDMAKVLKAAGYEVTLLTGAAANKTLKPTKDNIENHLKSVLRGCRKNDTVLVAFAGHGLQFEKLKETDPSDAYFCPVDARPFRDERATLVSLTGVYGELDKSFAGMKVLLVDACRDDPDAGRGSRGGITADSVRPPQGVAALFSCRAGERAFEHEKLGHGVFFHHVLEGLRGKAKDADGEVTFAGLASYVSRRVSKDVPELVGGGARQSPNLKADYSIEPVLVGPSRPSETVAPVIRPRPTDTPELIKPPAAPNGSPQYAHGFNFRVRSGVSNNFDANTSKVAVECYRDETNRAVIGLSDMGYLAVTPVKSIGAEKNAISITGHSLRVRKTGETEFTTNTKVFGVELFKDLASNHLLYVSETGSIAFAPVPADLAKDKGPKWHHALEPKVRGPEETAFDKAKMFGVEVSKDSNTGGLIYITETGAIATAAAPLAPPDKDQVKNPKPLYGLVLQVRKADEQSFTDATRRWGVEVFEDPNSGVLLFVTETGAVATAPRRAKLSDARGVLWLSAMTLKARKVGETSFNTAKAYGVEVFKDNRTGYLVYVCETGSIAVLPQ